MALYTNSGFTPDPWHRVDIASDMPVEGQVIVTLDLWRRLELPQRQTNLAFGLQLEPGHAVESIAGDLPLLALVAIAFPKFTDGRGYSMARQIRDRYGFSGELRATGDVLFDQIQLMARCGFNSFDITDRTTIKLLEAGRHPIMSHFYQPGEGQEREVSAGHWRRRPNAAE